MLNKVNRVNKADDFRFIMRKGRKVFGKHFAVYSVTDPTVDAVQFGFVISKVVGNSVVRHHVTRLLRVVARDMLAELPAGTRVVIRGLQAGDQLTLADVEAEVRKSLKRVVG